MEPQQARRWVSRRRARRGRWAWRLGSRFFTPAGTAHAPLPKEFGRLRTPASRRPVMVSGTSATPHALDMPNEDRAWWHSILVRARDWEGGWGSPTPGSAAGAVRARWAGRVDALSGDTWFEDHRGAGGGRPFAWGAPGDARIDGRLGCAGDLCTARGGGAVGRADLVERGSPNGPECAGAERRPASLRRGGSGRL